jgi:hypothetical protein
MYTKQRAGIIHSTTLQKITASRPAKLQLGSERETARTRDNSSSPSMNTDKIVAMPHTEAEILDHHNELRTMILP